MGAAKPMREVPRGNKVDVAEQIKAYILEESLRPGDPLPTESELTEAISASRTSVREAIKTLAALDIVDVRHGHGSYVGSLSMSALVESLAFRGLLSTGTDGKVMADLVDIRLMIEQGLARMMIDTLSDDDLAKLRALASQMVDHASRHESYVDQDRAFHITLMRALGNDLVVQLTEAFWEVQARVAPSLNVAEPDWRATADAHVEIVEALTAKDVERTRAAFIAHYEPLRRHIAELRSAVVH